MLKNYAEHLSTMRRENDKLSQVMCAL